MVGSSNIFLSFSIGKCKKFIKNAKQKVGTTKVHRNSIKTIQVWKTKESEKQKTRIPIPYYNPINEILKA